ncbi:glycoside hydrolase [Diplogelasinospora grovesii]|uniref:Glycoside hydrolase n=1 Tax=Diplogelasinospora grovesii TaxID=303347 RepID=A0AAN6MV30_9PEZI|nr:glycoside hydrolase [Diplogelasinospora grovesii]
MPPTLRRYNLPGIPTGAKLNGRDLSDSWWLASLGPEYPGTWPFGDDADYRVFRNVMDYGATGTGTTDDTAAINAAIADGNRCGSGCTTSSVKGALVYFPPGTYLVSSPIISLYNTQLVGDGASWPVILAAPSFAGQGVITSDVYLPGASGAEWYTDTANFYRQVRNFVIDMTQCTTSGVWGLHWQVAQATSLQNLYFSMTDGSTSTQVGIYAENGSGGFMSDLIFTEGNTGITLTFVQTWRAVSMLWDWGWTWKGLNVLDATFGIWFDSTVVGGSLCILDSMFSTVEVPIYITTPSAGAHQKVIVNLNNFALDNCLVGVLNADGTVALSGGTVTIPAWTYGQVYNSDQPDGVWVAGEPVDPLHPVTRMLTDSTGAYFELSKPQYETVAASQWMSALSVAKGDGVSDDTAALGIMFAIAHVFQPYVYIPAGSYMVSSTVKIPIGVNVVGSCWAQIVATGSNFQDMNNPLAVVQVGNPNDVGSVQLQDLLITVQGNTAGAVLMEWNAQQASQASTAMWDVHFRVGGALGSNLQVANCPTLTGGVNPGCIAASAMLHITEFSALYMENVWAWTADHDLDSSSEAQVDVYTARGILIESLGPVWMVGTASEHAVMYQYNLVGAENVWMGMIQTESPYYPPVPIAPQPFTTTGQFPGDPSFASCQDTGCKAAWALSLTNSTNIQITGAGLYSWFSDYSQTCVDTQNCQDSLMTTHDCGDIYLMNLYTVGATNMLMPDSLTGMPGVSASSNTVENAHPFVAAIAQWEYENPSWYVAGIRTLFI